MSKSLNESLLVRYIRMALAEATQARVPNQLLSPIQNDQDGEAEDGNDEETTENVNEFSGAGSIAGYSAPLGMDPDKLGRKKNKSSHKK